MNITLVNDGIFPILYNEFGEKIKDKKLDTGFEVSGCVQGEGQFMGVPSLFLRTSGCNLRCWVLKPGSSIPKVAYPNGKFKKITEVQKGDVILALDEKTQKLSETTVSDILVNTTKEWYQVTIEKIGTVNLTAEHPLLTTKGWKRVDELKEDDILLHINSKERRSYRMKRNNPMKNKTISVKMHSNKNYLATRKISGVKSAIVRKEKNIVNVFTPEARKKISESKLGDKNPMKRLEVKTKAFTTRANRPLWSTKKSSIEKKTIDLIKELGLEDEIWYTGMSSFFVTDKLTKKVRVPDFKIHNSNKFIETAIQYIRRPNLEKYKQETKEFYSRNGYDVLVLDCNLPKEEQSKQLMSFVHNGLKVLKVKRFSNISFYENSKPTTREYSTYNLHCLPHNNYLVKTTKSHETIISHNCTWKDNICDTAYSSFSPESNKMDIQTIANIIRHNIGNMLHLVITGGEPLLQAVAINELLELIKDLNLVITVETNGTIFNEQLFDKIDLISLSPKLSSSVPTKEKLEAHQITLGEHWLEKHNKERLNLNTLQSVIDYVNYKNTYGGNKSYQLKFVVQSKEDIEEIKKDYLEKLIGWVPQDIYLMPEGTASECLKEKSLWIIEECIKEGFNFCPRLHVDLFGKARSV